MMACDSAPEQISIGDAEVVAMAREIHERVVTIDTHDDIPFEFATPEVDPGAWGDRQVDLPKMRQGGLDVAFFIVYVGQGERSDEGHAAAKQQALTKFEAIRRMTEMYPQEVELATSADDVTRIVAGGKLVAAIGIENGYVVGRDLSLLQIYHELGARYMTLAHNGHNEICDSANPRLSLGDSEVEHDGVSPFGEQVIAEMNRLGMMVDVSHVSKTAMLEAAARSRAPVIASHSSCRALCDVSRNLDDEQLLALKDNGGVVQIVALSEFLNTDSTERKAAIARLRAELDPPDSLSAAQLQTLGGDERQEVERRLAIFAERVASEIDPTMPPAERADIDDFIDHIDHAVGLIGIDHVGISSDFDGGGGIDGWNNASETFNVTLGLVRRGYSEEEIAQLWGGNTLRVWRQVEDVARRLQAEAAG